MQKELIALCGMNCRICIAYFGYRIDGEKRKNACAGCKQSNKHCAFVMKRCINPEMKNIGYCYECEYFPCENLEKLDRRYRKRFNMSMIDNLRFIEEFGMNRFLKEQEEKYSCPECGNLICVHNNVCYNCGI